MKSKNVTPAVVAGVLTASTLSAGIAFAASNTGPTTIKACANKTTGALHTQVRKCTSAERALTWNAQGPQGLPGASGVSKVFAAYHDASVDPVNLPADTPLKISAGRYRIVTLNLPAGKYAITAKVVISDPHNEGGGSLCQLETGSDFDTAIALPTPPPTQNTLPLQVVHTFVTAGAVSLNCQLGQHAASTAKITAIATDILTNTAS